MANGKPTNAEFSVKKRNEKRLNRTIEIGGKMFKPNPESTETRAAERTLQREQRQVNAELLELAEKTDKASLDRVDELELESETLLYKQVAVGIRDAEQDTPPDVEFLQAHLPTSDIGPLFDFLAEGGDESADPS